LKYLLFGKFFEQMKLKKKWVCGFELSLDNN
jgi:hypothetical protein